MASVTCRTGWRPTHAAEGRDRRHPLGVGLGAQRRPDDRATTLDARGECRLATSGDSGATVIVGVEWSDDRSRTADRALKRRPRAATRRVPAPPPLVALLIQHLDAYGTSPDGRLVVTRRGADYRARPLDQRVHPGLAEGAPDGVRQGAAGLAAGPGEVPPEACRRVPIVGSSEKWRTSPGSGRTMPVYPITGALPCVVGVLPGSGVIVSCSLPPVCSSRVVVADRCLLPSLVTSA
jgi:hypothetical protein